jgi:hypothetical protein
MKNEKNIKSKKYLSSNMVKKKNILLYLPFVLMGIGFALVMVGSKSFFVVMQPMVVFYNTFPLFVLNDSFFGLVLFVIGVGWFAYNSRD